MNFVIGQRWISHTESHLGLGIVSEVSGRLVSVKYPAAAEERSYATSNAPLSRVIYKVGDTVKTHDELSIVITKVDERHGLIFYSGDDSQRQSHTFTEIELDCFVRFNSPEQRLMANLFDTDSVYRLRIDTLKQTHRLQTSPVKGLLGPRTSLLPHQVYIANEVSKRYAPRVLLADEVGLGKTIEAGMILHQQLHNGLAERIMIIVPDTLVYQWLVEMLRKFNLKFAIFDEQRYQSITEESPQINPFDTEQLIICSLSFLKDNPEVNASCQDAQWDLLIVDEAHHLQWSVNENEISDEYLIVEELSKVSAGLLLLTATPEQMGIDSHFARLRLLDPARYHDLDSFIKEESNYGNLVTLVKNLQKFTDAQQLSTSEQLTQVASYLDRPLATLQQQILEQDNVELFINHIIALLLDRQGTGRVLFRNTRNAIPNFPQRVLLPAPLERPKHYDYEDLYPELNFVGEHWVKEDPRVNWLIEQVKALWPKKVLVICANDSTAQTIERYIKLKAGIRSAAFYRGMSIVERDSAAAYFSDMEDGAQVLICSEIGSEGRNFQFAHHLVLFDLPLNPDLLEQRIGRLDRIGQQHSINIHVPYFTHSAQEVLFNWFDKGLKQFTRSCSIGNSIYQQFKQPLHELLEHHDQIQLLQLIEDTSDYTEQSLIKIEQGRDPLLEFNSCQPEKAHQLITLLKDESKQSRIDTYSKNVFDIFGIEREEHSENAVILHPTDQMLLDRFPGMGDESLTITTHRGTALSREDMIYLTWEHPILSETMEMIIGGDMGNATITSLPLKSIPAGTLLIEAFYSIRCMAPKKLQLERFFPLTPTRYLTSIQGKDLSAVLSFEQLNDRCQRMRRNIVQGVIPKIRPQIEAMAKHSKALAEQQLTPKINDYKARYNGFINAEIQRLEALQKLNSSIRNDEIEFYQQHISLAEDYIKKATVECEAIRVIITT